MRRDLNISMRQGVCGWNFTNGLMNDGEGFCSEKWHERCGRPRVKIEVVGCMLALEMMAWRFRERPQLQLDSLCDRLDTMIISKLSTTRQHVSNDTIATWSLVTFCSLFVHLKLPITHCTKRL